MRVAPRNPEAIRIQVIFGNIPLLGQERGNIQALQTLAGAGCDVLFVTNDAYGHETIQPALDQRGLKWTTGTYPGFFSLRMSPRKWAERLREWARGNVDFFRAAKAYKPTHIHAGNERFLLNLVPALWVLRLPVVFRVGDAPRLHHPVFRFLWRAFIVPTVTQFVPISQFIASRLRDAGASDERLRVIYSYPPERSAPGVPFAAEPFDGTTVAYVGQLSEEKGVDLLVEVALALCRSRSDVRFLLAGDYTWQNPFAERLIRQVDEAGFSDRVRFLGYVEDVPGLLGQSGLHVCPSVWEEPLSNVVPEAKLAGVPSVVFPSGGLPELIEHGVDGWVCRDKTTEALREGIEAYLDAGPDTRPTRSDVTSSLRRLGITKEAFKEAWSEVYERA